MGCILLIVVVLAGGGSAPTGIPGAELENSFSVAALLCGHFYNLIDYAEFSPKMYALLLPIWCQRIKHYCLDMRLSTFHETFFKTFRKLQKKVLETVKNFWNYSENLQKSPQLPGNSR